MDSSETMKERKENLEKQLEENGSQCKDFSDHANPPSPSSDKEISHLLFDHCNESVKQIYTYLNHYKNVEPPALKAVKEGVKAIERLREYLAEYL